MCIRGSLGTLDAELAKGYALLVGIAGTFVGAFISGKRFKPKRRILEDASGEDIEEILRSAGMTPVSYTHLAEKPWMEAGGNCGLFIKTSGWCLV